MNSEMPNNMAGQPAGNFQQTLEWNRALPCAVDEDVGDLIQKHALEDLERQAICAHDGSLTYAHLDELSTRLAGRLSTAGVGPETIVPVLFEKSLWTIVSILAVLKAGGAFVMLDPSQPLPRLRSVVDQTGASFALSSMACASTCDALVQQVFVVTNESVSSLPGTASGQYLTAAEKDSAAYLIFTSGSTGQPKGVIIERSQLSTTCKYTGHGLSYGKGTRVLQFASYAFDACITDIFATLVCGGTLCIPSEWERNNSMLDTMRRMAVTSAKFTPSLAASLDLETVPTLQTLVFGGESSPSSLISRFAKQMRVVLVYGPTECTVICMAADASARDVVAGELGSPVGARVWVTRPDDVGELVQVGEVGELLIEGPLVGRGYLHDAAKTGARFVSAPAWMSGLAGISKDTRLYRTGDLCRYLEDGTLLYVGRIDNQVKVRGQRLELEEVEKALHDCLCRMESVEAMQVVVEAATPLGLANRQLVAFLHVKTDESIGHLDYEAEPHPVFSVTTAEQERSSKLISRIESQLSSILPAFAVPSLWITLPHLPLTISRKPDRKRLRGIVSAFTASDLSIFANYVVPSALEPFASSQLAEKEVKLQALWAELLCIPVTDIRPSDNFFRLGGDSVIGIKLISVARTRAGMVITLDVIFSHPTLSGMASVAGSIDTSEASEVSTHPFSLLGTRDTRLARHEASVRCSVPENAIEDIYPCSPMQEGLLALSLKDPGTYILQFVYQMPHSVDLNRLRAAWESVAKRVAVMRTRFFDYDGEVFQAVIDERLSWKITEGDLGEFLVAEKAQQLELGKRNSHQTVVRQPKGDHHFLVWTVHHALVDGWTESDIVTWVEEEYYGDLGRRVNVPSYSLFIKHIGHQDEHIARRFWKNALAGAPAPVFPPLPDPGYVPKVQRSNRVLHHVESHEEAEMEHHITAIENSSATVATMIQAAWFVVMGIYSNTSDVVTGVTLNGRTAPVPDIDVLPGTTISTVPFRVQFTKSQTVQSLLQNTQQQYLSILPHSQFGLQNIRQLSQEAASACKFRSLLVVQSANRRQISRKLLLGRSYSFPVMDFAIVMECEILDGRVDFRATFDHQVLSESDVQGLFKNMEAILHKIATSDSSTTVSELQAIVPPPSTFLAKSHEQTTSLSPKTNGAAPREAPSTMFEKRIHELWRDLLQTDKFGIDDNFFEMGGGSVLAMRLVSSARRAGLSLTVHRVFKSPTVRGLASIASRSVKSAPIPPFVLLGDTEALELQKEAALQCGCSLETVEDIYPCSRMQLHYVTGYPEAKRDPFDPWNWQSQTTWAIPQAVDIAKLKAAWETVIQRHQPLRTRLVRTSRGIFQAVLRETTGIEWGEMAVLDNYLQADRSKHMAFGDRLLRLAVVGPGEGSQRYLVITIHHTTYDAYARNLLFGEVEKTYFGDELPKEPPADMNRFIKYITEADKATAAHFWTSYLGGSSTKPLLSASPWHCHDPFNQMEKLMVTEVPNLDGSPVTLPTVIEVTCGLAISRRLGCPDVIFYSDRAGRNLPVYGIQDLIGATTLFTPLRVHIDAEEELSNLLWTTQRSKAAMMPYEHMGWLELREEDHLKQPLSHSLNLNISPYGFASMSPRLGLSFVGSHVTFDDAFGINVDLYDDRIEWVVYFDERFITAGVVEALLTELEHAFNQISYAPSEPGVTVGEIIGRIRGPENCNGSNV